MPISYRPPEHPRREPSFPRTSTAELGMNVALASFGMLFLSTLIGFVVVRYDNPEFRGQAPVDLPLGLWLSTAWLLLLFWTLRRAETTLGRNALDSFRFWLQSSLGLAVLFLLTQAANWTSLFASNAGPTLRNLYVYSFVFLTGLHALHVVGGVVPLVVIAARARLTNYSSSRSEGLRLTRRYWDFLLLVWVILIATLLLVL